jgi:hypothetical protein
MSIIEKIKENFLQKFISNWQLNSEKANLEFLKQ